MYSYLKPRERALQAGMQVYISPLLLASALEQLERLADKRKSDIKKIKRAGPGCVVELLDLKDQNQASFELVMPNDATPKHNRISVLSPLGSSLLGLQKGDLSRVDLWGCSHLFQILRIRYPDPITTRKEETPS
jgi:transcription elongation GreA/GreB family factor